ncbi:MAG: hypothetical protein ACR2I2_19680 [Bryobacteraceae bacterium]
MSTSSINNLSSAYLQPILSALQDAGLAATKTNASNSVSEIDLSVSISQLPDHSRLSPFAQLVSTLQQLQESDPAKYQQVTQQIATNLQSAAQTAQSDGNAAQASQLNKLASDFTNASKTGQLPDIQDLAQAAGGRHGHRHSHSAAADSDGDSSANSSSTASIGVSSSGSASQTLSQLLSAFQANGAQSDALNPISIILNTLSTAK